MVRIPPNGNSRRPDLSADGKKVVFHSEATNLVEPSTNDRFQIFVADLESGELEMVSLNDDGVAGNGNAYHASISADGSRVVFSSDSTTLVPGEQTSFEDIYVRDLNTGTLERLSVNSSGEVGNSASTRPSISHDGSRVAFASRARNLVPGDTSYGRDIFVKDLAQGWMRRINLGPRAEEANRLSNHPIISGNGRFVAYTSHADNLVEGDTNGRQDVFVHDLATGQTERVSVASDDVEGNGTSYEPSISDDGRFVAFYSRADNLVEGDTNEALDVFVRDRQLGTTERVSLTYRGEQSQGASFRAAISGDGSCVGFVSAAPDMVEREGYGWDEVYVRDRVRGVTEKISVGSRGARTKASSTAPTLSHDGSKVAFTSWASNLMNEETRNRADIYLRDRQSGLTERLSQPTQEES